MAILEIKEVVALFNVERDRLEYWALATLNTSALMIHAQLVRSTNGVKARGTAVLLIPREETAMSKFMCVCMCEKKNE